MLPCYLETVGTVIAWEHVTIFSTVISRARDLRRRLLNHTVMVRFSRPQNPIYHSLKNNGHVWVGDVP